MSLPMRCHPNPLSASSLAPPIVDGFVLSADSADVATTQPRHTPRLRPRRTVFNPICPQPTSSSITSRDRGAGQIPIALRSH